MISMPKESSKTILVTGGAGFIGANFIPFFLAAHPGYRIINLDKLTYAGNLGNLAEIQDHPRYEFVRGDICSRDLLNLLFAKHDVRGVINFAAESHVDNSIREPDVFIKTNILGSFNLVDAARSHWLAAPHCPRPGYEYCRFHQISTDEVYGSLGEAGLFSEQTPYDPSSPYSSSKAAADLIVRSYFRTFGLNAVITSCSNNYGPKQHDEKLIPTIIRKAMALEKIPIYGDGKNTRDWLFVQDHCTAIDAVFHRGQAGETYNIGGLNEQENFNIAGLICDILDEICGQNLLGSEIKSYRELITFVSDRPGHDRRYAMDITKISSELGWQPETRFAAGLRQTVEWHMNKYKGQPA